MEKYLGAIILLINITINKKGSIYVGIYVLCYEIHFSLVMMLNTVDVHYLYYSRHEMFVTTDSEDIFHYGFVHNVSLWLLKVKTLLSCYDWRTEIFELRKPIRSRHYSRSIEVCKEDLLILYFIRLCIVSEPSHSPLKICA